MNKSLAYRSNLDDSLIHNYSMQTEVRHFYKVILLGTVAVGKTSILRQYCENKFDSEYACTISADFRTKSLLIDHNTWVELNIWDTCGQEKYKNLTKQYYKNAKGCILVFDITERTTFDEVIGWIEDLRENGDDDTTILLVGNKADQERRMVSLQEGAELAKKFKYDYIETSAKTGKNINILFEILCKSMIKNSEDFEFKRYKSGSDKNKIVNSSGYYNLNKTYLSNDDSKIKNKNCC